MLAAWLLLPAAADAQNAQGAQGAQGAQAAVRVLQTVNALRAAGGLPPLRWDATLGRTAGAYAGALELRGELAHRDPQGGSALERYHRQGGTSVLVGEVLGTGPSAEVGIAAWRDSSAHREALLDPRWTHAGAGSVPLAAGAELWVMMFTRLLVEDLRVEPGPGGYLLEGRFAAAAGGVVQPVLLSGIRVLPPASWQAGQRRFRYLLPEAQGRLYHRLGYLTEEGQTRITDVLFPAGLVTCAPETAPR